MEAYTPTPDFYRDYISHHGIKGQKWGVKNGPPYPLDSSKSTGKRLKESGSVTKKKAIPSNAVKTETAKKSIIDKSSPEYKDKVHRLASGDFNANKQERQAHKEYEDAVSKLNKPGNSYSEWYGEDGKLTKKAKDYMTKTEALYEKYRAVEKKAWDESQKEKKQLREDLFNNKDIKPKTEKLKETLTELRSLEDKTIGENSPYAKKAYKEYVDKLKKSGEDLGDVDYGFYHYQWRSGNPAYDAANAEYKKLSKQLSSDYDNMITEVAKEIAGEYSGQKVKSENKYVNGHEYTNLIGSELTYFINDLYWEQKQRERQQMKHSDVNGIYLSDIELTDEILEHYGVKGMKWGVRKDPYVRVGNTRARRVADTGTGTRGTSSYGSIVRKPANRNVATRTPAGTTSSTATVRTNDPTKTNWNASGPVKAKAKSTTSSLLASASGSKSKSGKKGKSGKSAEQKAKEKAEKEAAKKKKQEEREAAKKKKEAEKAAKAANKKESSGSKGSSKGGEKTSSKSSGNEEKLKKELESYKQQLADLAKEKQKTQISETYTKYLESLLEKGNKKSQLSKLDTEDVKKRWERKKKASGVRHDDMEDGAIMIFPEELMKPDLKEITRGC